MHPTNFSVETAQNRQKKGFRWFLWYLNTSAIASIRFCTNFSVINIVESFLNSSYWTSSPFIAARLESENWRISPSLSPRPCCCPVFVMHVKTGGPVRQVNPWQRLTQRLWVSGSLRRYYNLSYTLCLIILNCIYKFF